jgi:ABC-type antimicrobial peptide transport system permease subunit
LGASIPNLIFFLSKEFMITVGIGLFIGIPISYYLLQSWLEKFAYKVDLTWWMFAIPALLAIFIAGLTISTQAIRAAVINPIQSLRSE